VRCPLVFEVLIAGAPPGGMEMLDVPDPFLAANPIRSTIARLNACAGPCGPLSITFRNTPVSTELPNGKFVWTSWKSWPAMMRSYVESNASSPSAIYGE